MDEAWSRARRLALEAQIRDLTHDLGRVAVLVGMRKISAEGYRLATAELKAKRSALEMELAELAMGGPGSERDARTTRH